MRSVTVTKHLAYIYIFFFENKLFPNTAVQQRQHVDAVVSPLFFSGLISVFFFDILQIGSGCIH
jgi:hypothetical protein